MSEDLAIRIAALDAAVRLHVATISEGHKVTDAQVVAMAKNFETHYLRSGK